jgi:hypothetical protein
VKPLSQTLPDVYDFSRKMWKETLRRIHSCGYVVENARESRKGPLGDTAINNYYNIGGRKPGVKIRIRVTRRLEENLPKILGKVAQTVAKPKIATICS